MPPDPLDWYASQPVACLLYEVTQSIYSLNTNCMSGHSIQWSDMLSGHLKLVRFVTVCDIIDTGYR